MQQIHNRLRESSKAYFDWHEHPHHKKVHWGVTILVAIIFGMLMLNGIEKWQSTVYNFVSIGFSPRSAVLTLDPKEKSLKVGDSFVANIILDTDGKPVDGVDLYSLHYDPTILSVVDDMPQKSGIQVTAGALMDVNIVNTVNQSTGTIKFSQAAQAGNSFNGKGVLASIHFKAIGPGNTYLKFDFALGNTKDTNVAHSGRDQLANVVDALYVVTEK